MVPRFQIHGLGPDVIMKLDTILGIYQLSDLSQMNHTNHVEMLHLKPFEAVRLVELLLALQAEREVEGVPH